MAHIAGWKSLRTKYDPAPIATPSTSGSFNLKAQEASKQKPADFDSPLPTITKRETSFKVPPSITTVDVHMIDTSSYLKSRASDYLNPPISGHAVLSMTSYAFLIRHRDSDTNMLFDLGLRKDWKHGLPPVLKTLLDPSQNPNVPLHICVDRDIRDIIDANHHSSKIKSTQIHTVIWSHSHFDHRGDISRFGPNTSLVIGPGTRSASLPGHPSCVNSDFCESDLEGRRVHEMRLEDFSLRIGGFRAYDAFDDGSFYLLYCPGHAQGHMGALARTTPSTETSKGSFVFLAGDCAHHCAEIRPSIYMPLPQSISFNFVHSSFTNDLKPGPPEIQMSQLPCCIGSNIQDALHPDRVANMPFYRLPHEPLCHDRDDARKTIQKLQVLDAHDDVLVCLSHDATLRSILPLFPAKLNDWQKRGFKQQLRWEFLRDFDLSGCMQGSSN